MWFVGADLSEWYTHLAEKHPPQHAAKHLPGYPRVVMPH